MPKLSAVVFFSEKLHGVTPITEGERNVFVVELWDNDDLPPGHGRSDPKYFEEYKNSESGRNYQHEANLSDEEEFLEAEGEALDD